MRRIIDKAGWMLAGVLTLVLLSTFAGVVRGGPLDPPEAPSSTYKTLDLIPPSWMQILRADGTADACDSPRFQCVMGGEAVLDLETGLVWQRTPSVFVQAYINAFEECRPLEINQRLGWRMPSLSEFQTLFDDSGPSGLPEGHPFVHGMTTTENSVFWTTTEWGGGAISVLIPASGHQLSQKTDSYRAWCVRGPGDVQKQY